MFPGGVLIGHDQDLDAALAETRRRMAQPGPVTLFEATFRHEGVLVRVDVLERDEQGRLTDLSRVLAERLKPGARIITVDVKLLNSVDKVNFVPMASLEGANEETGPASVGHIFRLENA